VAPRPQSTEAESQLLCQRTPRGAHGPATPDTPAQWATEREAALHVEERYRAARRRLKTPTSTLANHLTTSVEHSGGANPGERQAIIAGRTGPGA
jgi:hypothetical protein